MINFLCLLCSLCIQFGAVGLTPFNMLPLNTENESYIDTVKSQITGSKSRYWGSFSNYANVPSDYWVVVKGYNSTGSDIVCLCPNEYVDNTKTTTITCDAFNTDENGVVSSAKLKFNQYTAFPVATNKFWVDSNANIYGWKTYDFLGGNWSLLYCNIPIYYNGALIISITDDVTVPTDPQLPGVGSLSPGGHSSGGSPLESLQGFSWSAHTSSYTQNGHNTHVNPSNSIPDFTNATQNLLGQIVDNTNSLISNTNSLGGALETINGNIINGASAIFNAVSQLNSNFVSSVIIDKEELNDQWTASNTYLAFVSMNNSFNLLQSTAEDLIDRYSATEDIDELIIPIDLTVWQIESTNFGDFKPFNQVYYMRFGFLDETKALWQPLFIALLYFCLFYGIVLDLPNIIRGVKS